MSELFFGQCRCCLAEGSHRDAKQEYYENGVTEVYYDMFVTCFNLHLCHNISNTLICSSCVQELRVASEFRAKVLDSEQKLINALKNNRMFMEVQPLENDVEFKMETVSEDVKKESFEDEDSRASLVQHKVSRRNNPPSSAQIEQIVVFMESRPKLARGCGRTANARDRNRAAWSEIEAALNSQSGGCIKSWQEWSKYWKDKKGAVKRKASLIAAARRRAGGEAEDVPVLSAAEQKILAIMGEVNLEINPLEVQEVTEGVATVTDCSPSILEISLNEEAVAPMLQHENCTEALDEPEELVSGEAELLARFRAGALTPLPTRTSLYSICGTYVAHLDHLRGKVIPSKKILKHSKPSKNKIYLTEKLTHVANVRTLLENSNITPFKARYGAGFQCFYCRKTCENLQELIDHQREEKKTDIKRLSLSKGLDGLVIYVDVTDLKCTLCDIKIDTLNNLKAHLIKEHKKLWHNDIEDRVIPFKLSEENFECQICKFTFETFVSIERHMNVHFRNYVCECGAGFMTKLRLKIHIKTVHKSGTFPCDLCKKIFNTAYKYRSHVDAVHKKAKRSKCPKCFERFSDCHKRQRHMVEVHGSAPLVFKCNVCDKSFSRRYQLTCHLKRSHLEEKEIQCQLCSYMCCTNSELNKHMVSHKNSRSFVCDVCKKAYARKKTLKEHMRIHNNDRRFTCAVCGQAFVQNCSLKGHMKTRHSEFVT